MSITLNGRLAISLFVMFLSGGGTWATYVTLRLSAQDNQLAVLQTMLAERTQSIERRLDNLDRSQDDLREMRKTLDALASSPHRK